MYEKIKMDLKDDGEIVVMKNSIMFLRLFFLFPSKEEIGNPEKNVFFKFTMMNIIASYFPMGIILHLVKNIRSKFKLKYFS